MGNGIVRIWRLAPVAGQTNTQTRMRFYVYSMDCLLFILILKKFNRISFLIKPQLKKD